MNCGKTILAMGALIMMAFIAGIQHFAHGIRIEAAAAPERIRAMDRDGNLGVVVATGSAGRIEAGFQLMMDQEASRMLISGIGDGVSKEDILGIAGKGASRGREALAGKLDCCVDLDAKAINTKGNASETISWVRANRIDQIILVTADFHMPRALVEFDRLMPGLRVQPFPVPTPGLGVDDAGNTLWLRSWGRILTVTREYGKYLASLVG